MTKVPEVITIYVQLRDEGVDVWRPAHPEHLSGDHYRLLGAVPEDEQWAFLPGTVVRCERRALSGGFESVAICEVSHEPCVGK